MSKPPIRVAVTGAAGQIGYTLLFRIAAGEMLGHDQPIILQLLDLPHAQKICRGVMMEIEDCAFPLLESMFTTDNPDIAFKDADICMLVGAKPRGPGMERADLLTANGTNAYIARAAAIKVGRTNPANYHAMIRLDHNRAISMIAEKTGRPVTSLRKMAVWGNHSPTMFADYRSCTSNGESVKQMINDHVWNNEVFLPTVGKRGAAIIEARGVSSAASAASAAIDHIRDWCFGSDDWATMGVPSDGSYGVPEGLVFGFPCDCKNGSYKIVQGIETTDYSREKIRKNIQELLDEAAAVKDML